MTSAAVYNILFCVENGRFDGEFPWLPDIRRVLDTDMKCDGQSSQQNDSGPSRLRRRLNASLFYASPPSDDTALSITATVDATSAGRSSSPVFALSDVTDGVDGDLLRAVFLLSDLVVLVYRLTATYVTVRALRRRFAGRPCPPGCRSAGHAVVVDSGSTLRSSSSRTALTSTSAHAVVADASNIYVDPQSLVVDNCASLLRRPGASVDVASAACDRRCSDARYSSGRLDVVCTVALSHSQNAGFFFILYIGKYVKAKCRTIIAQSQSTKNAHPSSKFRSREVSVSLNTESDRNVTSV